MVIFLTPKGTKWYSSVYSAGLPFSQSPIYWQGVDHVAAAHMGLFSSNDFWRNVRYYLLQFPTVAQRERYQLNR